MVHYSRGLHPVIFEPLNKCLDLIRILSGEHGSINLMSQTPIGSHLNLNRSTPNAQTLF